MWLFLLFLLVPLIEIALFIQVGGWIGLFPTLVIVVVTAVLGTVLVRSQGLQVLASLRSSFNDLRDPTEPLAHGAMILFAGALLLTPGFFTDAVGFALLTPGVRRILQREIGKRIEVHTAQTHQRTAPRDWPEAGASGGRGETLEGEYTVDENPPRPGNSGWTRH